MSAYIATYVCRCGTTRTDRWGPLKVSGLEPWQVSLVAIPPRCHVCGEPMERKDPREEGAE